MLLLVGLGNPGARYAGNRHNIGFMAADLIVRRHGFSPWRKRFQGEAAEGTLDGEKVLVLKPQTFMNNSGQSVGEAMNFYKLTPDDVVVLYDEIDLAPAKVKVKKGGGAAGHNGIRSIDAHIGPDFWRVRLGVGHPGDKSRVHGYVLSDFSKAEDGWLEKLLDAVSDAIPLMARKQDGKFMTKVALLTQPPPEKKPPPAEA